MTIYSVTGGEPKLLDEYRGDRIFGQVYTIRKNDAPQYEVTISTLGDWCNCPGGQHHGKCKHINMVYDYIKEKGHAKE